MRLWFFVCVMCPFMLNAMKQSVSQKCSQEIRTIISVDLKDRLKNLTVKIPVHDKILRAFDHEYGTALDALQEKKQKILFGMSYYIHAYRMQLFKENCNWARQLFWQGKLTRAADTVERTMARLAKSFTDHLDLLKRVCEQRKKRNFEGEGNAIELCKNMLDLIDKRVAAGTVCKLPQMVKDEVPKFLEDKCPGLTKLYNAIRANCEPLPDESRANLAINKPYIEVFSDYKNDNELGFTVPGDLVSLDISASLQESFNERCLQEEIFHLQDAVVIEREILKNMKNILLDRRVKELFLEDAVTEFDTDSDDDDKKDKKQNN